MPCPRCASVTAPGAAFCAICGTNLANTAAPSAIPPPIMAGYPQQPAMMMQQRTSGMAIAGFVLSFFCSVLGLIFSIMGHNECKRSGGTVGGGGLAVAGIVISLVGLVLGVLYVVLILVAVNSTHHAMYTY